MKLLRTSIIAFAFLAVLFVPHADARAATIEEMLAQIQALMVQIQDLQKQLANIRGEVRSVLKDGLQEGMTDADIEKIQALLATDPTIYPEGKRTGYFGPLTKEALKRFQARHELEVTGMLDPETKDLLDEYLHEGFGDNIPPGLLRAPGIMKKIEARFVLGCDKHGHGMGPLCKKLRSASSTKDRNYNDPFDDDDDDYDSDDDDDDDSYEDDDDDDDSDDDNGVGTTTNSGNSGNGTTTVVSLATVATHNTASNCWLIVSGKAYDVTQYAQYHPGGTSAITNRCGTDATTLFNSNSNGGHKHSNSARNQLNNYLVGTVQ